MKLVISQAKILLFISMRACVLSRYCCVGLFATQWTIALQALLPILCLNLLIYKKETIIKPTSQGCCRYSKNEETLLQNSNEITDFDNDHQFFPASQRDKLLHASR